MKANPSNTKLRKAAQALVDQLNVVHLSPEYYNIWMTAAAYTATVYKGPTYIDELAALRTVLKEKSD